MTSAFSGFAAGGSDRVDVVAAARNMKQVLSLPISTERISMAVHRVGGTLVLDGDVMLRPPPPRTQQSLDRNKQDRLERQWLQQNLVEEHTFSSAASRVEDDGAVITNFVPPAIGDRVVESVFPLRTEPRFHTDRF